MINPTKELKDIIELGLRSDIFKMERAYHIYKAISLNADTLNARENGNYGELFGSIQQTMANEVLLAVSRIYDRPSSRHPTRCFQRAVEILHQNIDNLPEIVEIYQTKQCLHFLGFQPDLIESVDKGKSEFLRLFVPIIRSKLDDPMMMAKVDNLKHLRDKEIAHNEGAVSAGPTWENLNELVSFAQSFVSVVGCAFFSTLYFYEGEYILSSDAQRPARALKRLVNTIVKRDIDTIASPSKPTHPTNP